MDLSKAIDVVTWEVFFSNPICNVRWGMLYQIPSMYKMESDKEEFLPLCNSVNTLTTLSSSKTGCQIQVVDMGKWEYADDNILFSPSRTGLQEMVKILLKLLN